MKVIELDHVDNKLPPPKKSCKTGETSTLSRQLRNKETTDRIEVVTEKCKESSSEKRIETYKTSELRTVEKKQTSKSNPKPVAQSGFNDQYGRSLPHSYTEQSM